MKIGILTGTTAAGKTAIALELVARHPQIEIVNADSMLVYRGMDIGTAKPSREELRQVPHHLVDIRDPEEPFTAGDFHALARQAIDEIHARGKRALVVGGTGFYLKALLYGLWQAPKADPALRRELERLANPALHAELAARDPEAATRIGGNDRYRLIRALELLRLTGKSPTELEAQVAPVPDPRFELYIIDRPNPELETRIGARTAAMLEQGLVGETRALLAKFPSARALGAVGYAQVRAHLDQLPPRGRKIRPGLEGLSDEIALATRQLVKRQRTWLRGQAVGRWFILDRDLNELCSALDATYGIAHES
ncbi:MAG: tRNA (adenosine(37)-N6)-dimethylallyltransferase MiaA [Oligoflexia bacterium]|nr:tRNA (adenosine(37)-N6)-dimethylallyltransferase MiaA [Oligoflexia bacterium]